MRNLNTRKKILNSAKKNFLQYGFNRASLRKIANDAQVTTGAIYFFFESKEDLWKSVLEPFISSVKEVFLRHYSLDFEIFKTANEMQQFEDLEAINALIDAFYDYRDEALIFVKNRDDEYVKSVLDSFISMSEDMISRFLKFLNLSIGRDFHHWICHIQLDNLIYIIEHCETRDQAHMFARPMVNFLSGGFYKFLESF